MHRLVPLLPRSHGRSATCRACEPGSPSGPAAWAVQDETPNAAETVGSLLLLVGVAAAVLRTRAGTRDRESVPA